MASIVAARESLSYAAARERVLAAAEPLPSEEIPLAEARGRALRLAVIAKHALPPFDNSAMDGFAVRACDLERATAGAQVELPVVEVIPAGSVPTRALRAGEAMRIMTGAMLPEGADAVVPVEEAESLRHADERVRFGRAAAPGQHVRRAGADLAAGASVLDVGRELSPYDLGLLASLGEARVRVSVRPRAAVLSTGDELIEVDQPLRPGAIRDSNALMLAALLEESGARVIRRERLSDDPARVGRAIGAALEAADLVLSIGGVSAGDFDPVKIGITAFPGVALWRVAMRAGQPQAFGALGGKLFFGLPGNPASVACVFEALVRPALRRLQGFAELDRPRIRVRVARAIPSRAGRTDFVRATLEWREEAWWATPSGEQVSGHMTPQAYAHALLIVPESATALASGEAAEALVLRWPESARR